MTTFEIPNFMKHPFEPATYAPFLTLWLKAGISVMEQFELLQNQAVDRYKQAVEYQSTLARERADRLVSISTRANRAIREQLARYLQPEQGAQG